MGVVLLVGSSFEWSGFGRCIVDTWSALDEVRPARLPARKRSPPSITSRDLRTSSGSIRSTWQRGLSGLLSWAPENMAETANEKLAFQGTPDHTLAHRDEGLYCYQHCFSQMSSVMPMVCAITTMKGTGNTVRTGHIVFGPL